MYNTTYVINQTTFIWQVMPFGGKNELPTYQFMVFNKKFKKYFAQLIRIFLDDFMVYNNMDTHLSK